MANEKKILIPLNELLKANDRLGSAIEATRQHWPHVKKCWIDHVLNEPTKLLEDHRLKS
jgi:hypothetical protein